MDSAVLIALITMISSAIVTPLVLWWVTSHNKAQEWARQDFVSTQLGQIKSFVDGAMTASMQSEYDAQVALLDMMHKAATAGGDVTQATAIAIAATTSKIAALRVRLDERQLQQKRMDAESARKG